MKRNKFMRLAALTLAFTLIGQPLMLNAQETAVPANTPMVIDELIDETTPAPASTAPPSSHEETCSDGLTIEEIVPDTSPSIEYMDETETETESESETETETESEFIPDEQLPDDTIIPGETETELLQTESETEALTETEETTEPSETELFESELESESELETEDPGIATLSLYDNSISTATWISTNSTYTDYLHDSSDVNWYKFTLSSSGYISLTFSHGYIESSSSYWTADICNSNQSYLASYSFYGNNTSETTGNIGLPAGTYYIKIDSYRYSNLNYYIKVNYSSSSVWEKEFNDSYSTADAINVNSYYYGSMRNDNDADWYKFSLSNAGSVSLSFAHNYIESSSTYWKIDLYNSSQSYLVTYDFYGNVTSDTTGKIGLPAGTYYLKIYDYRYSNINYNFKINYSSSSYWEKEFNDSYSTADTINVNTKYYGTTRHDNDVDWYKFSISKSGPVSLTFSHDYIESGSTYWKVELYNSSQSYLVTYSFYGNTTSATTGKIGLPAGTYYLKIYDYYYSDMDYNINVNYFSSTAWEKEFNDSYSTAENISLNVTRYGTMRHDNDVDWYKFKLTSSGMQMLYFNHDYIASGRTYWKLYLYDSSMAQIAEYSYYGDTTSSKERLNLSAGTYYIKITDYDYSDATYNFKITKHNHAFKDVITKATTDSNGMVTETCFCGETGASSVIYAASEMKLSTSTFTYTGGMKRPSVTLRDSEGYIIDDSNYTVTYPSGRREVGSYTVKVTLKNYYKGTMARTFVIRPESTYIYEYDTTSSSFTVYWDDVDDITGYQVQYSTSSNFSGGYSTIRTIANAYAYRFTCRGLYSDCDYYVRVRAYKTVSGKKYYSQWSSYEVVTTEW